MKKLIAVLLAFTFLFSVLPLSPVVAEDREPEKLTMEEAIEIANKELEEDYYKTSNQILMQDKYVTMELNREIWDTRQILVYGSPTDVCTGPNDIDKSKKPDEPGYYRYLGYTKNGDKVPDPKYKADHSSTMLINNYNWIKEPWKKDVIKTAEVTEDRWDGQAENLPYIQYGLKLMYEKRPHLFDSKIRPKNTVGEENWHTVVKMLQPRTSVTPGVGRMWHLWDSNNDGVDEEWYIHFFIPVEIPAEIDIEVVSISNSSPVPVGTDQTAKVVIRNNSNEEKTFEVQYSVDSKPIKTETYTLGGGKSLNTHFSWTAPDKAQDVVLKAFAVPIPNEKDLSNNEKSCTVKVETLKPPTKKGCADQPSISNTWDELYTWKVRHDDIIEVTDPETGKTTLEPYTWYEDKSEIVEYKETLSATLSVNTKQGIPTDPKRPKESDRESRGSWDIIPWARKNGLNPNEVTRAGYGFEVKVETEYSNDWESKVPEGASPKGGKFYGPNSVEVEFYDTRGNFVLRKALTPTRGKIDSQNVTWELPSEKYTFQDGKTIYERKHYTNVNVPDGRYTVIIRASGAGKTDLCLIQRKDVIIYGTMYDDIYTSVGK